MEYQVLSEDCRKSLEVKSEKIWFAECQKMTLDKGASLPSARRRHSAKESLCRVLGPMALDKDFFKKIKKKLFAECLARWHSANN